MTEWNPDYLKVVNWRNEQLINLVGNPELLRAAKIYYAAHPIEFIEHWCVTYDPRNAGSDKPSRMPFILFPKQKEMVTYLCQLINAQENGLVEKSRDMGATWVCCAFSVWLFLFKDGAAVGWGSRKEQLVDKLGDPDSIFEKMRMIFRGIPPVFLPKGFSEKSMSYMKVINPENDATVTGESGDNIGRGGRSLIYFKDEAQPLTSLVLTPSGFRQMGYLAVSDEVMGVDGNPTCITHINDCGEADTYRFTLSDGTTVESSENHLWAVDKVNGKRERVTLRTHEIADKYVYESPKGQKQYRLRLPLNKTVDFGRDPVLPLNPYIVGVLLGDGSVKYVPRYRPTFTSGDPWIGNEVARLLPATMWVGHTEGTIEYRLNDIKGRRGRFKTSRASQAIMATGIAGHGSNTKFIPDSYKYAQVSDRLSMLQGLMDTDGHANCHGGASFHSNSKQLADDVAFIVRSLGGIAYRNVKPDARGYADQYMITVVLPDGMCPFRLPRKVEIVNRKTALSRSIVKVEQTGRQLVRCITVENEDGLYLTDDFIVTHNSAHYERPEKIEAALADNTNCQVDISSVNGLGNVFHRRREAGVDWNGEVIRGKTNVFVMDWRDNPLKSQEWYDARRAKAIEEGMLHIFEQEVNRNYASSVEGILIPADWVSSAIDAHLKLGFEDDGGYVAGLDVADEGRDTNAQCLRKGIVLKSIEEWSERDTGATARRSVALLEGKTVSVQYDCIGVGAGVKAETNRLKDEGLMPKSLSYVAWNAGAGVINPDDHVIPKDRQSPINKDFYTNLKAQAGWELRKRFERTHQAITEGVEHDSEDLISIDSTIPLLRKLQKELSQATVGRGAKMKLLINKTPDGTKSPNLADAVAMCYFPVPPKSTYSLANL